MGSEPADEYRRERGSGFSCAGRRLEAAAPLGKADGKRRAPASTSAARCAAAAAAGAAAAGPEVVSERTSGVAGGCRTNSKVGTDRLGLHGAGPLTDKPHRQRGKRPCPLSVSSETPAGSQARKFWPLSQSSSDPLQSRPATTIIYIYTYVSFLRPHKRLITKIPLHNHMHDHIHIYTYESFLREYDCNTLA